jgi:DNA-binding MarR family transcriptional regulator
MASACGPRSREPFIRLLDVAFAEFDAELSRRLAASAYADIRPAHGCVFGHIDPDGSRLTDLADRARMTKQSVGEVATDLEQRGYVERVPDPSDGRAKIIRLTTRGHEAQTLGWDLIDEIEREWAERFGAEQITALRETLQAVTAERLGAIPAWPAEELAIKGAVRRRRATM